MVHHALQLPKMQTASFVVNVICCSVFFTSKHLLLSEELEEPEAIATSLIWHQTYACGKPRGFLSDTARVESVIERREALSLKRLSSKFIEI